MRHRNLARILLAICVGFFFISTVSAQSKTLPQAVRLLAQQAFKSEKAATVQQCFLKGIQKLHSPSEKIQAFEVLADYESLAGLYEAAAEHYKSAAFISDHQGSQRRILLIKALRAILSSGDDTAALKLAESLEAHIPYPPQKEDYTLHVYRLWLDFRLGYKPYDRLKQFLNDSHYASFHPALLFSLWWFSQDAGAKERLEKRYPNSIENAVVQGKTELKPSVFWYLMPRSGTALDNFNHTIQQKTQTSKTKNQKTKKQSSTPQWHQVGFFKSARHAKKLARELQQKGFSVKITKESRKNGAVFYTVLVAHKANTVIKLRDAGYESVPVF